MSLIYFYKAAGAILLILSCASASGGYAHSVSAALDAALDAERFVRYVSECIRYRADTVDVIIASYESDVDYMRAVWKNAAETSLADAIQSAPFDSTTRRIMTEFAAKLGRGYREPQTELCAFTAEQLRAHADALSSSKSDRLRVARAVSVFICMSIIILFI